MSGNNFQRIYSLIVVLLIAVQGLAQQDSTSSGYPPVDENLLVESKWLYAYTAHSPTNSIIHEADESYEYYLYLRYDNKYEHYLNGASSTGGWLLNETKNELYYNFRQIKWWKIAELSKNAMVLEFNVEDVPYQYHFVRVPFSTAPFPKAANELPDVEVNADVERRIAEAKEGLSAREKRLERSKERKKARQAKRDDRLNNLATKPTTIEVAITGGGFYGGIDPVIKNFTVIKSDGRLIKEFQSINRGLVKTKKDIGRDEVEKLVEFILSKGFFEFDNLYDCQTRDCNKRKVLKPTPIPLRVSVTYGNRRKVVTVSIWGLDDKQIQYVNYPKELELIIEGIYRLSEGLN